MKYNIKLLEKEHQNDQMQYENKHEEKRAVVGGGLLETNKRIKHTIAVK